MSKILYQATGILKIVAVLIISSYKPILLVSVTTSILTAEIICFLQFFKQNGWRFKNNSFFEKENVMKLSITLIISYALILIVVAIFKKSAFMALLFLIVVLTVLELIRVAIYIISKKRTGRQLDDR